MHQEKDTTEKDTIKCPQCGAFFPMTQALEHQLTDSLRLEYEEKISAHERALKQELEKHKAAFAREAKKQAEEGISLELKDLRFALKDKEEKLETAQNAELALRKRERELEDRAKNIELETARKISAERTRVEEEISRRLGDSYRMREAEKEKKISDMMRQIEELKRKAEQGSQQTQGEVQELDLENVLRRTFPTDTIEPIGKGVKGADVRQTVRTSSGNVCGVLLWESKNTKQWSDEWLMKLKDDLRAEKANIPIIVSKALPSEAEHGIGWKHGVWVCTPALAAAFAEVMRQRLIEIARAQFISQNRAGKGEELYEYITSHEFRQQVEAIIEVYGGMNEQILKERAAFEKQWRMREAQAHKLLKSTAGMIGGMQGRIGPSMPHIKGLDLLTAGSEEL